MVVTNAAILNVPCFGLFFIVKQSSPLLSRSVCRKEWASLGNLEKEEAMVEFVKLLNKCCNLFAPYVTSHKIEREEQERKR